jgi:hypothetical protein
MNDGQPLIEKYETNVAAALREMADHVERNRDANSFGGLAVIIPPPNGGDPIKMLILDQKGDVTQFYATVSSRIQMAVTELDEMKRQQQGFGRR